MNKALGILGILGLWTAAPGCGTSGAADEDGTETETETETAGTDAGDGPTDYSMPGPRVVGNVQSSLDASGRTLPVEFWYPASESARDDALTGQALSSFGASPDQQLSLEMLAAAAPAQCPRTQTGSAATADALDGPFPMIVFSHCHSCARFSEFSVAERLASHGFVVVALDHVDGTLFDELDGTPGDVDADFLTVRGQDVTALLDAIEDPTGAVVPATLAGRIDMSAVGMFGHSFGGATTGRTLQDDDRVRAGVSIAAPMESILLPGVSIANIDEPVLYLLATEDNSITEIGNNFIRDNYANAIAPAWLAEVTDAGHWSFSDLVGLIDLFMPGCGDDMRQTVPTETFTYLEPIIAREITQHMVTAFFAAHLLDDEDGRAQLDAPVHGEHVVVTQRG